MRLRTSPRALPTSRVTAVLTTALLMAALTAAVLLVPPAAGGAATASGPDLAPAAQPTCADPAWRATAVYVVGDRVSHQGRAWRAKWWTQGEEPGTTGQWRVWDDLGACQSAPPTTGPPAGGTPVAEHGRLYVCGTALCGQHGRPVQLRGMSTHGLQWYRDCVNAASLDALATDWRADVLRISMYVQEGGYETNPRYYTDLVHDLIEQATARGMYAIVDWHMLTPGDPHHNLDRAKTFFTEIAQRHRGKDNVLYEVANEPSGVSWSRIKSYHEQIIPVIRAADPQSVILLGTRAWSSLGLSEGGDETEVINNPVDASNIMYTFHFYAASHGTSYLQALSRAADRIPMFVTEFGTQDYSGDGANDFTMSQRYLDLMAQKQISWVNWNFSDDHRSGAVFTTGTCPHGPFAGTSHLKPAGQWIRDHLRNR